MGRDDLEAEGAQGGQVRLDGARTEVAATGVRQPERRVVVQERPEEHDDRAGAAGGRDVDAVEVELLGRDDLEVVAAGEPSGSDADRGSTSRIRLTSSMRARLRSVVRPRLSSDAQSSATAAFLDVLTSIEPLSFWPPTMRRCCGPEWPRETNSESRVSPIWASMSRLRFCLPCSMRVTALWLVPSELASSDWVIPLWRRASRIRDPIRPR